MCAMEANVGAGGAPPDSGAVDAFALGWHVAELYHIDHMPKGSPEKGQLPGVGSLDLKDRNDLLDRQIRTGIKNLLGDDNLWNTNVEVMHTALLITLTVKDGALGNAYGLGRALAETVLLADAAVPGSFETMFKSYRVEAMKGWLNRLDSSLPKYAAAAVGLNLDAWGNWVSLRVKPAPALVEKQREQIGRCLRLQSNVWYGLLSGEMPSTSLLTPEAYLSAGEGLARKIGRLAWQFLRTGIGVVMSALIIALALLLVLVWSTGHQDAMAGTVVLLLGSVGLTVGGVATSARQVLQQAEGPIWHAEVAGSVAVAALRLPDAKARQALATTPL